MVGELEQLALGLEVLVQEIDLGPGGEPLELVLQRPEVEAERLGVHQGLAGHAHPQQALGLAHLVQIGEERGEKADHRHHGEPDEHGAPQAAVRLTPGH